MNRKAKRIQNNMIDPKHDDRILAILERHGADLIEQWRKLYAPDMYEQLNKTPPKITNKRYDLSVTEVVTPVLNRTMFRRREDAQTVSYDSYDDGATGLKLRVHNLKRDDEFPERSR